MPFRPLQDHVLIRRLPAETMSPGGLVIPDTAQEKSLQGEVLAVGRGRMLDSGALRKPEVKVGDRVVFSARARGHEIEVEGEKRVLMPHDDLLAVFERGS